MLHCPLQYPNRLPEDQGFTLIESMVVVVLISAIIAIALPNYQQHVVNNAQTQAQQQGLTVADQLVRWRSKRLSYAGFELLNRDTAINKDEIESNQTNNPANSDRGLLYLPLGSEAHSYRYVLTLKDANGTGILSHDSVNGNGWRMLISPNPYSQLLKYADHYYLDSLGQRCLFEYGMTIPDIASDFQCHHSW